MKGRGAVGSARLRSDWEERPFRPFGRAPGEDLEWSHDMFGKPPVDPEGRRDRDDGGGRYAGGRDGGRDGGEGAFRDRGDRPPMPRGGTWGDVMERDGERDRAPRRQQRSSPSPPPKSDWKLKAGGVYVR